MGVNDELVDQLSKRLADQGKLIEAGWLAYKLTVMPKVFSRAQEEEVKKAFFSGAQHLFGSIMSFLDKDAEPTPDDLRRMDQLNDELTAFVQSLMAETVTRRGGGKA